MYTTSLFVYYLNTFGKSFQHYMNSVMTDNISTFEGLH